MSGMSKYKKGRLLTRISLFVGVIGFIVFVGSAGSYHPEIPTNYNGILTGLSLVAVAFFLGTRKSSRFYTQKKFNNIA